jgi:hypothetical protein
MADEMITRSEFFEYMQAFEERLTTRFDQRMDGLEQRMGGLEQRMGGVEHRMNIQFEETRSLIRLSLEGLDALRETTERGFAEIRSENHDNRTLLEAAVKHVRRRVERVEDQQR